VPLKEISMAAKKKKSGNGRRKYGAAATKKVKKVMHERKTGTLRSGSGAKVKDKKQAIAIGLSEARKAGAKVPKKKAGGARKKRGRKS
jgi:hypothetical protein